MMENRPWIRSYDHVVPATIRYPEIPIFEMLDLPASTHPDKVAIEFLDTEITFLEVREEIVRLANALAGIGLGKGDRVVLHMPNCPQYMIAYYAVLLNGAIVVNANPMYTVPELEYVVSETSPKAIFTFDGALPTISRLLESVEIPRVVVTTVREYAGGGTAKNVQDEWHGFRELVGGGSRTLPRIEVTPWDPAQIQFTGGTTGVPKGAVLTHANLVTATYQSVMWGNGVFDLVPVAERRTLVVIPYFHVYGNIVGMNSSLLNGSTQILVPRFDLDEFVSLVARQERITYFPSVPTMINALVNHPRAPELRLDRKIGLLGSGSAPMPVELIHQVRDLGIVYSEGWGMSESTALGSSNPILGRKKVGSIGIAFPDTDVRIVDLDSGTEDVPAGEPGELIMKGPLVMQGYWNAPEKTADQVRDGWLYTGDIATRDEDWYLYIVDRKKDMIIAGGYNIYPREIDEVLHEHPKIQMAVSAGVPDAYRGETVKAFVVLREGESATEEEIIAFCRERLAAYKAPKLVEFRSSLPTSAVGKVLRRMLRDEEAAGGG